MFKAFCSLLESASRFDWMRVHENNGVIIIRLFSYAFCIIFKIILSYCIVSVKLSDSSCVEKNTEKGERQEIAYYSFHYPLLILPSLCSSLPLWGIVVTRIYRKELFNTRTVISFDRYNIKRDLPTTLFGIIGKCEMQSVNSFCGIKCYKIWRKTLREWVAIWVLPEIFIVVAILTLIITCM